MRYAIFLGLLLCVVPAQAAITDTGVGCAVAGTGTTCGSSGVISGILPGDFIYAFAFRSATTAPTLPATFTQIATASASSSSFRSGCAIATATTFTVSGWTNATYLLVEVYRGVRANTTAVCVSSGVGFHTTTGTSGTTSTITYTGGTLSDTGGTSWIIGASGSSADTCTPSNLHAKQTITGPAALLNDSNATVTAYATTTCAGTTSNWKSDTLELRGTYGVFKICSGSSSSSGMTATCSLTGTTVSGQPVVIFVEKEANQTATISDSGTNIYLATTLSPCHETTNLRTMYVYYAVNATAVTNPTYTVTWSGSDTDYRQIVVGQLTGTGSGGAFANDSCNFANTSSVADPGAGTLISGNYAILEGDVVANVDAVGTGFTQLSNDGGNVTQYKTVRSATWGASAFADTNANWIAVGAAFTDYVAPASGCSTGRLSLMGVGC